MLVTGRCGLEADGGVIEGDFRTVREWMNLHPDYQPIGAFRQSMFLFGERETGPAIFLTAREPVDDGSEVQVPAHHHRTATFRAMVGASPKQDKNGPDWLGSGDFLAMGSNVHYSERIGTDGHWSVVMEADRRGGVSLFARRDLAEVMRQFRQKAESVFGFSWPLWEQDADRPDGTLATTFGEAESRARLVGSMDDPTWDRLADGSAVGIVLIGDPETGPAVILTRNAPGVVEAAAGSYGTDRFRLVYSGSCMIGDRLFEAGQFKFMEADVAEGSVVHGPEGSTQMLVLADRRARLSPTDGTGQASSREAEIERLVATARCLN